MAPKVKFALRQEAPPNDTLFKIFFAAVKIGEPASKRKIANVANISSQLVDYHIDKLVDTGLLIASTGKYMAQEAFFDRDVIETMEKAVVTESLIQSLVEKMIFNQAKGDAEEVIEEAIIACVRLFSVSLRGKAQ